MRFVKVHPSFPLHDARLLNAVFKLWYPTWIFYIFPVALYVFKLDLSTISVGMD